jgi:L,D-transpeptidase YcbB
MKAFLASNGAFVLGMAIASPALARPIAKPPTNPEPVSILPASMTAPAAPTPTVAPPPVAAPVQTPTPTVEPVIVTAPPILPMPAWTFADAQSLLSAIERSGIRGLNSADYDPAGLRATMANGVGEALNLAAGNAFKLLVADVRDGRTPAAARLQWLVKDSDAEAFPTDTLMRQALATHDVEAVLASVDPTDPEYAALAAALVKTPLSSVAQRKLIRVNMDRWRWLPHSLGVKHVIANVPEYMLRVVTYGKTISTNKVIVGKMDTQTPSLMADATAIVVHPPWTIPRSLIRQEVGPMIARSPAAARARGYTWTGSGPTLSVVQQPGPHAALGFLKVDLPNPDAIFIHDTPNRGLFTSYPRAFSHGCLRVDRALELGMILGALQGGGSVDDLVVLIKEGKTKRVPFKENLPVIIGYFTYATGIDGKLQSMPDIYGRDVPILASLDQPRPAPVPLKPKVPVPPVLPTTDVTVLR